LFIQNYSLKGDELQVFLRKTGKNQEKQEKTKIIIMVLLGFSLFFPVFSKDTLSVSGIALRFFENKKITLGIVLKFSRKFERNVER